MAGKIWEKLRNLLQLDHLVHFMKNFRLSAFEGLSLYGLMQIYFKGIVQGTLSIRASAISFNLFIALFPLLIFLITLAPFLIQYVSVGNENFDAQFLAFLESFLPRATGEYFGQIYSQIKDQKSGGLLSSSFVFSIFLMANGVNAIFGGFESSYHIMLTRNFFKQYAYALMVGLILSVLIIVGAIFYLYFEVYILKYLSDFAARTGGYVLEKGEIRGAKIGKVLFFILLTYLTTAILYYFGTAEGKQAKFFSYGALLTTMLFLLTSYLFGVYVEKIANYNELYGALGGLLILMVYMWINSNILLLGFELNATLNFLRNKQQKDDVPQ